MEVFVDGTPHVMAPDLAMPASRPGWWALEVAEASAGSSYLFSLDGGPLRPDPRSPSQPEGPDGPSRLIDHGSFSWSDEDWRGVHLPSAVLYELHVGTFTPEGTFEAAAERLAHLAGLGIDAVELLPVAEAGGERGWGYDGVDWFAPHHAYGGPDGLKRFIDAAHGAGVGVVIDVVYNHLRPASNYLAEVGPYFTDAYRTNWGDALNLDGPYSDEVRRFIVDNATAWLEHYHADGLRLDAVHALFDRSAVHLLEQLSSEVRVLSARLGRPMFLIAESDLNAPRFVRPVDEGGYGLDASWADEFHHALHAVLTGETDGYYSDFGSLSLLKRALERAWVYAGDWSPHRLRTHGRLPTGLSGDRFVVFLQNHDQIGNRATGDRISEAAGRRRTMIGAAFVVLSPFIPLLFQGEEWMASSPFQYFTDHEDPELGRAVTEGRQSEFSAFGWALEEVPDPQDKATFERSKLCWDELSLPEHASVLSWYRALIAFRKKCPGLGGGAPFLTRCVVDESASTLAVHRPELCLAGNLAVEEREIPLEVDVVLALASDDGARLEAGRIVLPAESVAVLLPREPQLS